MAINNAETVTSYSPFQELIGPVIGEGWHSKVSTLGGDELDELAKEFEDITRERYP